MKSPFLTGEKIYLSGLTKEDITAEYIQWFNDGEVCKDNSHAVFPNNYARSLEYVETIEKSERDLVFAIRWNQNDEHIGCVSIQGINWINRSAEIAIIIGNKSYWGKGIGAECYRLLIEYAFGTLNLSRVSSGMTCRNKGMTKVCEKVCMKKESIMRQAMYKNGEYLDIVLYSILREEYENKSGKVK